MEIVLYLEVNLICIAILLIVLFKDAEQRKNDVFHITFKRVQISCIFLFISDIVWGVLSLSNTPEPELNWIVNIIYFSMSGFVGYFWLGFVNEMIDSDNNRKRIISFIQLLPMIILVALSVASVKTHWLFYIDGSGKYHRGELYILQILLAYILPIYATVKAIIATIKAENSETKRQYRSVALFYVLPAIGGVMQVVVQGTPLLNIGIALSGLLVYFSFQDKMIMLDALTSMNNRRYFDNRLESHIRNFDPDTGKHLFLIMTDIDYFKKINDGYGHAEGDRALITVSTVLKKVCAEYNCIVARIGGDEFAAFLESGNDSPEELCRAIHKNLKDSTENYPYKLKLSIGYSEYTEGMTAQQLYINTDKSLYEVKKSRPRITTKTV